MLIFSNVPIPTKFQPPKKKIFVWASSADPKQQTELSQREK